MATATSHGRLRENIFHVPSPAHLDAAAITARVDRDHFACLRGLFSPAEMATALTRIRAGFAADRDHPAVGEPPRAVMRNFQKVAIGGAGNHWDYRPRFMRTIYNPLWEPDIYGMHAIFRRFAEVRNILQGRRRDFAVDHIEDGLWTAARLQHYPAGGGNISRHRDAVIATVTGDAGVERFHQLLLLLTSRGEDFTTGGAYLEQDGEVLDLESEYQAGDILIYDGTSMHGVQDIDPHVRPSLHRLDGRLVALVSLYRDMSADAHAYAGYESCTIDASAPDPTTPDPTTHPASGPVP
jgi:hypothetical protein